MKPGLYETLERIAAVINERKGGDVSKSYVARLLAESEDAILRKIGEEATEVILAAKSGEKLEVVRETADLWFHCLILLARQGLGPADVLVQHPPQPPVGRVVRVDQRVPLGRVALRVRVAQMLDDRVVEVEAADVGQAVLGEHLEPGLRPADHRRVERAAAEVVDREAAPDRDG